MAHNPNVKTKPSPLKSRLALVTGANRGMGFEIAAALARQGCDLVITARDAKTLGQSARQLEKLNVHTLAQTCDVRDPASVDYLFAIIRRLRRPLDFLINNAGIAHRARNVSDLPYPMWCDVIETNLTGTFLVTQAALAVMKKGSVIMNNLSVAAERVFPGSVRLLRLEAWGTRTHRHTPRRASSQRNPRNRPAPRRNRHRHLEHHVAKGAAQKNDVRRHGSPSRSQRPHACTRQRGRKNCD